MFHVRRSFLRQSRLDARSAVPQACRRWRFVSVLLDKPSRHFDIYSLVADQTAFAVYFELDRESFVKIVGHPIKVFSAERLFDHSDPPFNLNNERRL
jgi:hypothetical protein